MNGRHPLTLGGKGYLTDARPALVKLGLDQAQLRGGDDQRALCRVAHRLVTALGGWLQTGIVTQCGGLGQQAQATNLRSLAGQQLSVGGSPRLWDVLLQEWFHRLRRQQPQLAIIAESHAPEMLTRRLLDGLLDLAFMAEPAQLDVLQIEKIGAIVIVLVGTIPDSSVELALAGDYLMVDWGLAHALEHRRLFPDAP